MKKLLVFGALALAIFSSCNQVQQKTGYVNNTKVVSDYQEMKEAQEKWTKKNDEVRAELEKKAQQFQIEVEGFRNIAKSMNAGNREKRQNELLVKQQELQQEQQKRLQEIQQGSQVEIDSIISKVKDYIKEYGKKNGFTYIYGDNEAGGLLFAKDEFDLTNEILTELNKGETVK